MTARGRLVTAGGLALAGLFTCRGRDVPLDPPIRTVRMRSDLMGATVWFDPVGLWIAPGEVVRWVVEGGVHTTTAYHPANGKPLRIPEGAAPWNSGYLTDSGQTFDLRLEREGVYDYYCSPHELAGMVGRIVVGHPDPSDTATTDALPRAARTTLPSVKQIVDERIVRIRF